MLPSPAWKTLAMRRSCRSPTSVMNRRMCGQLGAGDDAVLGAVRRAEPADGAEGRLAALPDRDVFGLLAGPPGDRLLDDAAVGLDDLGDRLGLAVEPGVEAVDLDDQHGAGLGGEAEAERLLDGPDHQVVEHLQRRRDDPGGDDPADGLGGRVDRVEDAQEGPAGLGVAGQVDDRPGDDAEGPLVADDQAGQVVAGVVLGRRRRSRRAVPSGMTSVAPLMWLTVTPYLSVCGPPELVATLPPIVQAPWLDGSGA